MVNILQSSIVAIVRMFQSNPFRCYKTQNSIPYSVQVFPPLITLSVQNEIVMLALSLYEIFYSPADGVEGTLWTLPLVVAFVLTQRIRCSK